MWSPILRGAGGQRSLLICYADWLLSGCLSGCVCRMCVCVCCARVSQRRMFIHISNNTNRTEQTSRCQLPFIYLCLIIIKTGTVAKTMTILRPRHGIEIRIGIFISAFLFQIKKKKKVYYVCHDLWCIYVLWLPWFHFLNLKESAYECNLISLRQWTTCIYLYIPDSMVSLTTSTMGDFGLQLTMLAIRNDHINVQIVTFVTFCSKFNRLCRKQFYHFKGGKALEWGYN